MSPIPHIDEREASPRGPYVGEIIPPSNVLHTPLDPGPARSFGAAAVIPALIEADAAFAIQMVRTTVSREWMGLYARPQSMNTGHGKQGITTELAADIIEWSEEMRHPLMFAFFDGLETWEWAWLHNLGPASAVAVGDPATRGSSRFGWRPYRDEGFTVVKGPFRLPERVTHIDRAQGKLL